MKKRKIVLNGWSGSFSEMESVATAKHKFSAMILKEATFMDIARTQIIGKRSIRTTHIIPTVK